MDFREWSKRVFHHEVTEPAWYFRDEDLALIDVRPATALALLTELFSSSKETLKTYSGAQVNQGLYYLIDPGASNYAFALRDENIPWSSRNRCVESIGMLFSDLFAVRCSPHLMHLGEANASPINSICYIWWDLLPIKGRPKDLACVPLDNAILEIMEDTLKLDSVACQESALHGLGHWEKDYPERVRRIIDQFLSHQSTIRPALVEYANIARVGEVW